MLFQQAARPMLRRAAFTAAKRSSWRCMSTSPSPWADYAMGPPDPILGLTQAFHEDPSHLKIIVGVGAYRDDHGHPFVLPCVREAEKTAMDDGNNHEYLGIAGDSDFIDLALKFAYGDESVPLMENRVAGVQSLSGTGGLRVMGELLKTHGHKVIYVPNPTWGNHIPIFQNSGVEVRKYRYYDAKKSDLDFDNLIKDVRDMPEGSCILLHACAHNPTGMDPSMEQWKEISNVVKERNLLPFFDCAYQGFASGNAAEDAAAIRMFVEDGHYLALVQSFSKNFGLYGQRVGALSVVAASEDEAKRVESQMKMVIRPMYSNPPRYGARLITTILSDPQLSSDFIVECKDMADRINRMRGLLRSELEAAGSTRSWDHITHQIGMFCYSGLTPEEVTQMKEKHHIYCTMDGRISMAGVTSGNVNYIAHAMHDVTK